MTPIETALNLVEKFYSIEDSKENDDAWMDWYLAKRCAQVAVDELIESVYYLDDDSVDYYREVKHEIEQL
jgi:hypothetical protein